MFVLLIKYKFACKYSSKIKCKHLLTASQCTWYYGIGQLLEPIRVIWELYQLLRWYQETRRSRLDRLRPSRVEVGLIFNSCWDVSITKTDQIGRWYWTRLRSTRGCNALVDDDDDDETSWKTLVDALTTRGVSYFLSCVSDCTF